MKINHRIKMDLIRKRIPPRIDAMQDDAGCRVLQLELTADDRPWAIPADARVVIRYSKPDRTSGHYDTLPDGSRAWSSQGNALFITLAPQVLTAPGIVELSVTVTVGIARVTTFALLIEVQRCPTFGGISEDYSYVSAFLPQVAGGARQGQYLRISKVDGQGNILALESVSSAGGLNQESKALLLELLRSAVYTQNVSETLAALELRMEEEESSVPSSIAVAYSGGNVAIGTGLSYFLDKVSVTRYYTDGSSVLLDETQYVIGGTDIVVGANALLVTDVETGMTATFTVMGVPVLYSVTTTLLNKSEGSSTNISSSTAQSGSHYSITLTKPDRYDLVGITVTMGGADISASAVSGMTVSIPTVTGDIVITMAIKETEAAIYAVTKRLTNVTCSGTSTAIEGESYEATLTANSGYTLQSVIVAMGGVNITASVYSDGLVSIPCVTGTIVITATAASSAAEVTMTAISAEYTGGDVAIGTAVTELEGLTVTAHYSDGSSQTVEKYAVTGTIEEGSNTIVVSYNNFNTSFTVNSVEVIPATCLVSNQMTNAKTNNTLPGVAGGSMYTATITAKDGYVLESVTVTMGGKDITADVWDESTGIITIEKVTGNIIITAVAKEA